MVKHFCFLVVITSFFMACSGLGGIGVKEQEDGAVKLYLGKLQVPFFDSISVLVSAADMDTIHFSTKLIEDNIKIYGIPLGENRKFEVTVYADGGKAVQKGEANAAIIANQSAAISISLKAHYGFLKLEIPLGLANSENIHSGTLFLDALKYQMQIENGKGIFNTGALPLNQDFELRLELKDSSGQVLFFGRKKIKLSSLLQTEPMELQPNIGSAVLELEMSSIEPMQFLAVLPTSVSRAPEKYGEIFFTEIFVYGTGTEYIEIYNATLDTLKLSNCRIARNRSTTAVSYRLNMPESLTILPMNFLFFGRENVENADFNYEKFGLADEKQDIGFFCDNSVIDSLYYSKSEDNKFPLVKGKAMQLPLSNYADRANGESWCLGFSPKQDASCQ